MITTRKLFCIFVITRLIDIGRSQSYYLPLTRNQQQYGGNYGQIQTQKYEESDPNYDIRPFKHKQISFYIDISIHFNEEMAIRKSIRDLKYFLPWIDFKLVTSDNSCDLCFYKKPNTTESYSPKRKIFVADCLNCKKPKFVGYINKQILLVLGLSTWRAGLKNSILSRDSVFFDYPIYYEDVKNIAKKQYKYGYENVLLATNAMCNFLDFPYMHDFNNTNIKINRGETYELFIKYQKRFNIQGYQAMDYDDFIFMYLYNKHSRMSCLPFNFNRYKCITGSKYQKNLKYCDIKFKSLIKNNGNDKEIEIDTESEYDYSGENVDVTTTQIPNIDPDKDEQKTKISNNYGVGSGSSSSTYSPILKKSDESYSEKTMTVEQLSDEGSSSPTPKKSDESYGEITTESVINDDEYEYEYDIEKNNTKENTTSEKSDESSGERSGSPTRKISDESSGEKTTESIINDEEDEYEYDYDIEKNNAKENITIIENTTNTTITDDTRKNATIINNFFNGSLLSKSDDQLKQIFNENDQCDEDTEDPIENVTDATPPPDVNIFNEDELYSVNDDVNPSIYTNETKITKKMCKQKINYCNNLPKLFCALLNYFSTHVYQITNSTVIVNNF